MAEERCCEGKARGGGGAEERKRGGMKERGVQRKRGSGVRDQKPEEAEKLHSNQRQLWRV